MRTLTPAVLEAIPNIGPSIAEDLRRIGIHHPHQLVHQAPDDLYRSVCEVTGARQDPCLLDVFIAAVRFMEGDPPRPWWHYTAERKRRYASVTAPDSLTAARPRAAPPARRGRTRTTGARRSGA